MLRRHLNSWKKGVDSRSVRSKIPKNLMLFLYPITLERKKGSFDLIEEKKSISEEEDCNAHKTF